MQLAFDSSDDQSVTGGPVTESEWVTEIFRAVAVAKDDDTQVVDADADADGVRRGIRRRLRRDDSVQLSDQTGDD